jgi:hypothetical protein
VQVYSEYVLRTTEVNEFYFNGQVQLPQIIITVALLVRTHVSLPFMLLIPRLAGAYGSLRWRSTLAVAKQLS